MRVGVGEEECTVKYSVSAATYNASGIVRGCELDDEMLSDDLSHGTDDAANAPERAEIPLDDGASEDEFK